METQTLEKLPIQNKSISIGIAEDHKVMLEGLTSLLNEYNDINITVKALNGVSLLEQLKDIQPEVIIMDINMPEMDGLQATKIIKKDYPAIKILVLSMHDDLKLIRELLKIGADGFVLKNTGIDELKLAIDTVANLDTYFCKPIADKIMKVSNRTEPKKIKIANTTLKITVTGREIDVLKLICMEYTSSQIAGELFISINTVETHRKNLLSKIGCKNSVGLVKWAIKEEII